MFHSCSKNNGYKLTPGEIYTTGCGISNGYAYLADFKVNGRNALSWEKKFELDLWYVDNASIMLDLKILVLTLKKVFIREGILGNGSVTMKPFTGTQKSN